MYQSENKSDNIQANNYSAITYYLHPYCKNLLFTIVMFIGLYGIEALISLVIPTYQFSFHQLYALNARAFLLLCLALSFCGIKTRTTVLSIMLLMTLLQVFHFQYFGTYIQPISFYHAFAFPEEAAESFLDEMGSMLLPGFIVVFVGILLFSLNQMIGKPGFAPTYIPIVLLVLFVVDLAITHRILNHESGKLWHRQAKTIMPVPHMLAFQNMYRSLKYFVTGIVPKKIFGNISMFPEIPSPNINNPNPDINVVLIIGETLRAQQLSLLGYSEHNTTPRLEKLKDLTAHTIYSSGTMSITSVAGILNRLKHPGGTAQIAHQSNCLFKLAKRNSFTTHFITAYPKDYMTILENVICQNNIDHYITRSDFPKIGSPHDMALVEYLDHVDFKKNNFIVLHQRGSHPPYEDRYPASFKKFESEYNNSVLYTDHVITEVIKKVQLESKKSAYILFTSDHGELLHEEGLNGHGWFKKQVYEVPFLFFPHKTTRQDPFNDLAYIQSHYDMSTFITQALGYDQHVDRNNRKHVFINGSDIDGLAGYLHLTIENRITQSSELIR